MGRCNCSSVGSTGAAITDADCIAVTGAGTAADPFLLNPVVDPDPCNAYECRPTGIFVPDPDCPGEWTVYTPTWTTTGNPPSIGDGVLAGRYRRRGMSLEILINFVIGASTNIGTGSWQFGLPAGFLTDPGVSQIVAARVDSGASNVGFTGTAMWVGGQNACQDVRVTGLGDVGGVHSLGIFPLASGSPPFDVNNQAVAWGAGDFVLIGPGLLILQ